MIPIQQLIKLLEKMYDDLKPSKLGLKDKALELIEQTINNGFLNNDERTAILDMIGPIRHIND